MPASDPQSRPATQSDALDAMANGIRQLYARGDTGALATLRRLNTECPVAPTFHALLAASAPDHLFSGGSNLDTMTRRFAQVARIMAMKPDGLHGRRLGAVLHAIGISQTRLAMLLNAQRSTLDDLVRRTARRIAPSDEPMPYRELGRMLLLNGRPDARDELDALRLKIARDYQRAARASSHDTDRGSDD